VVPQHTRSASGRPRLAGGRAERPKATARRSATGSMDLLFHAIFGADGPRPPSPEAATSLEPAQPAPQMPFDAASPTAFEAELPRQMVLPRQKRQKKGPAPKPEPVEQGAANKPPDFVLKLYTMFKVRRNAFPRYGRANV
jgi:hypothetical protein